MQNLEWYLADLNSTGKNTIETVEKSLTDMFIRLVRIYPCLLVCGKVLNTITTIMSQICPFRETRENKTSQILSDLQQAYILRIFCI